MAAAARSLLGDSSAGDSRLHDVSRECLFAEAASVAAEDVSQIRTKVVLLGKVQESEEVLNALETIQEMEVPLMKAKESTPNSKLGHQFVRSLVKLEIELPFVKSETVEDFENENSEFGTVFVLEEFDSQPYDTLRKISTRILGPPVILRCARKGEPLPFTLRPLYCTCMLNLVLCFTGFKKEKLLTLVTMAHHMGATIRKEYTGKITHLVAHSTQSDKFRAAVSMGTPIMKAEWIFKAWEKRNEIDFHVADEAFRNEFKVPPFQDCVLTFLGFSKEELGSMEEMTEMQGGRHLPDVDETCTHLVIEDSIRQLPFEPSKKIFVVKQEWFWGSIQMDARAGESMYLYEESGSPTLKTPVSMLSLNTPNSTRKRRRLRDTLAQFTRETDNFSPFPPCKRPSAETSVSLGSLLDVSNTPDSCGETPKSSLKASKRYAAVPAKPSARWQVAMELYQTESNYVDILTTIIQIFKVPLEKEGQLGGPILAQEEIKTIFGSIPDILEVHTKIKSDLEEIILNWSENHSIGGIIQNYSKDLMKTYPPFVNFFEMSKDTIGKCVKQKPRFHAFLKINQAKPECGRQSLAELLIRPVQRLPSVVLLLNDLWKHTANDNPDKVSLENAVEILKEVMTHINEDKRKTEGQRQIFDVVYEVDGCPANLLSSHRNLVQRVETVVLDDELCDRGEQVTLFLFNDCLEIARKRHKISSFKSPHGQTRPPASLKHIVLMPLSQIKKVLDIKETEDCRSAFALLVRPPTEQSNLLFSFQLIVEEHKKDDWLKLLSRHVANTICKADAENIIFNTEPEILEVNTKDMDSTLSKASRAFKKTSKKVTRAFSFTKTPKRVLQQALMAHSTPDTKSPKRKGAHLGSRCTSTTSLAISCSSSTLGLSDSVMSANNITVQRSNSLDGAPIGRRPRNILHPSSSRQPRFYHVDSYAVTFISESTSNV
ncbi:protein ECT2 isoform X1 [Leucoraja erinacea]|uniref:protein ECT2 isoform X1 n=1 Tax=Leucoraja erinaceus TaxID=7782 RepID=UPI002453FE3C|nr:protein ECT2 isoform X1 [Leucoraja erinacea]